MDHKFLNRELSWLSFNHRVLQEAKDPSTPLYEKIKFLAIFSSNLDEFFRVRVASLRSLLDLKKKTQKELKFDVEKLLAKLHKTVVKMQEEYGETFTKVIKPELEQNNIFLVDHTQLNTVQKEFVSELFNSQVVPHIMPMIIARKKITPFLRNQRLYLAVKLSSKLNSRSDKQLKHKRYLSAIVEIPTNHIDRFILLPKIGNNNYIMFLDDIIRYFLPNIFYGYNVHESFAVKLTRDAELYIEDEFSGNLLDKMKKSLAKRSSGAPSRFLYDRAMPASFLNFLKEALLLSDEDLYPGGKYHNFSDFFSFPNPGMNELNYPEMKPLRSKALDSEKNLFTSASEKDKLLYFPYQSYDYVINAFEQAANDPDVKSIKVTQYRVAKDSRIVNALIKAAHRGKDVTAFVEIKARFDEEINIKSAEEMQKAGVKVLYSLPGLKVHAKIALITREENNVIKNYAYLSTGNFNEKTARLYTDYGYLTANPELTEEVAKVFEALEGKEINYEFRHLLVAHYGMREGFQALVDNEIAYAQKGMPAAITIKLNSLEDERMIKKLYEASSAGVKVNMIVRGICCLIPGIKNMSENIRGISIIDRFLEHDRVYMFNNGGNEKIFLSSADWMKRNLSRRIEVAFPIYDEDLKNIIKHILNIKLNDNVKARVIDEKQTNNYVTGESTTAHRSQYEIYDYMKSFK
ncbi:MAG TPA: polyphosphate kinase 1 [Ignavibacteria bacterium]|nr:polyphosphate kinase 1 [Ignavibacteria bacterium]HAX48893.1 polyphosphate kinase 1 [Bacteroidota bacterium]HRE12395.1 polyphosphate kinase 1 [Ignavibacteria bacterium]HRF64755.1 polyphosphate kinase 1 [Ignavibacteria bacterium]HRJ04286.1 polyphosphate kinase 1 [Ignavibacteria bacterium]